MPTLEFNSTIVAKKYSIEWELAPEMTYSVMALVTDRERIRDICFW